MNDTTILYMRESSATPFSHNDMVNLRWVEFPYSEDYTTTSISGDYLSHSLESYIYTEGYKFQFSDDNFNTTLVDSEFSSPNFSFRLADNYSGNGTQYYYRFCGSEEGYQTSWTPNLDFMFTQPTSILESAINPEEMKLLSNFPNPFNPSTTINYELPKQSKVKLTIFDIRGQEVMTLQDVQQEPGNHEIHWSGIDDSGNPVGTGVYICRLQAASYIQTIKMVYLK